MLNDREKVIRIRRDAADYISRVISDELMNAMEKHDTLNGDPYNQKL